MNLDQISDLIFLKLGGSLITVKNKPRTVRQDILPRLAGEIAQVWRQRPSLHLLIGHGSGSFGHVPAKKHHTRDGVSTRQDWLGFVEVWKEAAALNHMVMEALHAQGLPAIALPASAGLVSANRKTYQWDIYALYQSLTSGLLPVIYGDVVFDREIGGTIFSTEDLFVALAQELHPKSIYLAGIEAGVWADFPICSKLLEKLTPEMAAEITSGLDGAEAADVTGGMAGKVKEMISLVELMPNMKVLIFSGLQPNNVHRVLSGEILGTRIAAA